MSELPRKMRFSLAIPHFLNKKILQRYLIQHWQAAINGLNQLGRTPFVTVMTCIVIGIAIALPTTLFVLLKNIEILGKNYQQSSMLTLYLKPTTTEATVQTLLTSIRKHPDIQEAHAVSPTEGLRELREQAGIEDVIIDLNTNPLPWAIVISPISSYQTPRNLALLSQTLKRLPEVQSMQLDILWAQRLAAILSFAHRFIYVLGVFLAIGVLLIVNNCIRSVTEHNKKEISVIQFIGGTHAFVRRPFLYAGIIYGLLGGIMACQLVDFLLIVLRTPVHTLANLYQSQFHLQSLRLYDIFLLLISSMLLGLTGAWFAATRHLRSPSL